MIPKKQLEKIVNRHKARLNRLEEEKQNRITKPNINQNQRRRIEEHQQFLELKDVIYGKENY